MAGMDAFAVTRSGRPVGTITYEGGSDWRYHGPPPAPSMRERVMRPDRLGADCAELGLPANADEAAYIARTWGMRTSDPWEVVPPLWQEATTTIPFHDHGILPLGAGMTIAGTEVQWDGLPIAGRLPLSWEWFTGDTELWTATVIARASSVVVLEATRGPR